MKKKLLALALALILLFALSVPAFAGTQTVSAPGSNNSVLTYTVASTYTVTIPESAITVSKTDVYAPLGSAVQVPAGMLLNHGQKLTVKLYSANVADGKFNLVLTGDETTKVNYTIQKDGAAVTPAATAEAATTILEVSAGTTELQSAQLKYKIDGTATKSGSFTDTLTFVVAVATVQG